MDALQIWLLGFTAATMIAIAGTKFKCEDIAGQVAVAVHAAGLITIIMKLVGDAHGLTGWDWAGILIAAFIITKALNALWWLWDRLIGKR